MHRCSQPQADVIIDSFPYRLDALEELKRFMKHQGLKGIAFINLEQTTSRLTAAHKVTLLQKRRSSRKKAAAAVSQ